MTSMAALLGQLVAEGRVEAAAVERAGELLADEAPAGAARALRLRAAAIAAALLLGYALVGWYLLQQERQVALARPVFLALDANLVEVLARQSHMELRYPQLDAVWQEEIDFYDWLWDLIHNTRRGSTPPLRGELLLKLDERGVVVAAGEPAEDAVLTKAYVRVNFHRRGGNVFIGPTRYPYGEWEGARYHAARYAELRVKPDGNAVLVSLRDRELRPLGQPLFP
jgi:hypothetical protein